MVCSCHLCLIMLSHWMFSQKMNKKKKIFFLPQAIHYLSLKSSAMDNKKERMTEMNSCCC